uniref:KRAB-related domain-containing protein n=1 Tax=Mustela putorius furo TaxID=9669 RepID=M3YPV9_MUSPF
MNKGSSFAKNSKEDTQKSEKKCKAFKDISKYFSKEEWAKLGYSDKITYVYMKRNYDTMTSLGLRATLPAFMCPKKRAMQSNGRDSDDDQNENQAQDEAVMGFGSRFRNHQKVMLEKTIKEESDSEPIPITPGPEQAQKEPCPPEKASTSDQQSLNECSGKKLMSSVWAYRLRERKTLIVYEEISDPEEDD